MKERINSNANHLIIRSKMASQKDQQVSGSTSHKGCTVRSYIFKDKLKIIEYDEKHSISEAARCFRVDRRSVAEWKNNKTKISVLSEISNGLKTFEWSVGGWGFRMVLQPPK